MMFVLPRKFQEINRHGSRVYLGSVRDRSVGAKVPIRRRFCRKEQLEVARNGAVQQASSRGKADCFVLSSAAESSSDRELGWSLGYNLSFINRIYLTNWFKCATKRPFIRLTDKRILNGSSNSEPDTNNLAVTPCCFQPWWLNTSFVVYQCYFGPFRENDLAELGD